MQYTKIKRFLETSHTIALFGHIYPDGDCIGSMLGLGRLLEKQGKKVKYFVPTSPSKIFHFLQGIKKIKTSFDYGKYDLLIFVDFSQISRFQKSNSVDGNFEKYVEKSSLLVIDHHLSNAPSHALVIKDVQVMSTAELIFEHTYKWWPKLFDAEIATYLYMGLTTDSGNFVYDQDHERIFRNALRLVQLGANKTLIVQHLIQNISFDLIKFVQLVLKRIVLVDNILYSYYDEKEVLAYRLDLEETNYSLSIIQNIKGPQLMLLFKKVGREIRVSLRSKNMLIDCNKIASFFGGGGHKSAAGFTVFARGSFQKQIQNIVHQIKTLL